MAGKLGALRALLEAAEKPMSQIRDVGAAFLERSPLSYFEKFREPAVDIADASRRYGVEFAPTGPGKMAIRYPADDTSFYAKSLTPRRFDVVSRGEAPSLGRVIRDLGDVDLYEIDALASVAGGGAGSRMYPAILDAFSGGMGRVNVPTELTKINEMRRNLNSTDALLRNPSLTDTVLPIDQQLDRIRLTPEDYMGLDRQGRVGALALAHASKAMEAMDAIRKHSPDYRDAAAFRGALSSADMLSPMSSRSSFAAPALSVLSEKGIGPSTLKRMNIIDAILSERKINPDLWTGLGKREGGLV